MTTALRHRPDHPICPECEGAGCLPRNERAFVGGVRCGKTIAINWTCERCHGAGFLNANLGRIADEQRAIDADKAAHEATLPDYVQISHERAAAGESPY